MLHKKICGHGQSFSKRLFYTYSMSNPLHSHPLPLSSSPPPLSTHVMSSVEKLMMVGMKFSRIRILRIDFHSVVGSPISKQILSIAIFTSRGGCGRDRTSTRCCFFMPLTAVHENKESLMSMYSTVTRPCMQLPCCASFTAGSTLARSPSTMVRFC